MHEKEKVVDLQEKLKDGDRPLKRKVSSSSNSLVVVLNQAIASDSDSVGVNEPTVHNAMSRVVVGGRSIAVAPILRRKKRKLPARHRQTNESTTATTTIAPSPLSCPALLRARRQQSAALRWLSRGRGNGSRHCFPGSRRLGPIASASTTESRDFGLCPSDNDSSSTGWFLRSFFAWETLSQVWGRAASPLMKRLSDIERV